MDARPTALEVTATAVESVISALNHTGGRCGTIGGRRHIVLVGSDDDSREMYAEYLACVGIRVTAAVSATDALEVVRRDRPDVIVTFLRLPGLDGFALCDLLHALPDAAPMPIIAFSTCKPDHDRAERECGFAAVVMIPCLPSVLLELVLTTLAVGPQLS